MAAQLPSMLKLEVRVKGESKVKQQVGAGGREALLKGQKNPPFQSVALAIVKGKRRSRTGITLASDYASLMTSKRP
ncbi:hypothetical protein DL770_008707 [Monosporascus sp. CRB-9-2]|nr:hypothetical protein DL770_008707 [Monosporascus sp. CRB-9-2]